MLSFDNNQKNVVLVHPRDRSGCSHYRNRFQQVLLNSLENLNIEVVNSFSPIFDSNFLFRVKTIWCQRFVTPQDCELVKRYKALQPKYGYSLIFEVDDQCFPIDGKGIPEYNSASDNFNKNLEIYDNTLRETLHLYDEVVVSTEFLKEKLIERYGVTNVTVLKNAVPRYLWSYPRKNYITEDLKKPTVLYSGSPCHYLQPQQGKAPLKGDFNNAWCDWVIKNVREDKIEFICMGSLPWFWNDIAPKIKIIPWVPCMSYARAVMETNADFQIAPLADNNFNRCKSALRLYESCAAGQIFLGTTFDRSPYLEAHPLSQLDANATLEEIDERFKELCKKDVYNNVLNHQYDFVNSGYWMESDRYLNQLNSIIENRNNSLI